MTNARMSLSSILGAVSATANTLTNTVNAANQAVNMAGRAIDNAAGNQKLRLIKDQALYKRTLHEDAKVELSELIIRTAQFRAQSHAHATAYDEANKDLADLFKDA